MAQPADRLGDAVSMEALVRHQLILLGEDPSREGLRDTPERVKESLEFLTRGYRMTVDDVFGDATFTETYKDMVVVKDIEMYSLCEHHLLPFFGRVHIGYIPSGRLVGLSKMPRLVELYSRRLQVQERVTRQLLPEGPQGHGHARLLRRSVEDGGGQYHVLSDPARRRRCRLGGRGSAGLSIRRQGAPAHHAQPAHAQPGGSGPRAGARGCRLR